jgi:uncharacterized protein (DUF488 family)
MNKGSPIYTIGHSNHDLVTFLRLLKDNAIQVVVDVRSAPYSRYVPQFNKREIEAAVNGAGLKYVFMGDALGGKSSDPQYLHANIKVRYDKLAVSDSFQQGLDRLTNGLADGWIIALMCAEEDPLKCHRHLLIANEFELKRNIPVWHIRSDNTRIRAKSQLQKFSGQLELF